MFYYMYFILLFASVVIMFQTWYTNIFGVVARFVEPGPLELTVHSI